MATTLTIAKGDPSDVNVTVNQTDVLVTGQNNVSVEVTPAPRLEINVDYGMIGPQGAQGDAATIAVGTTTTGAAGSSATVTNSGTSSAAVFNFTIPQGIQGIQGVKGDTGATGPTGATGAGVATGGTTGQVLVKASNANYDTSWATITGTLSYQGGWNASTNSPTLTSSVGTNGFYYVVTVAGSTNLNGITDWQIGDWAIFNGSIWQKIDQTNLVTSVNGQTGAVSVGTVTSVSASAGTGISITGSPITTSGTLNITNTAPDQTVVLTGGTGISTSGTYPNFTITNTSPSSGGTVTSVATSGTVNGITLTGGPITSSGTVTLGGTLDLSSPPAIGGTTASTGRFTTVTSTVATGTAPFTVASTTPVTNLSIGGNAETVTNGVYTTDTGTVTNTMLAGSIANAKLINSSITFGSTAQALGSTVSGISGVTIDNGAVGAITPAAGTFTTLTATGQTSLGGTAGSEGLRVLSVASTVNWVQARGHITNNAPSIRAAGSDTNIGFGVSSQGTGAVSFYTNSISQEQLRVSHTASAVNYVQVTGNTSGGSPIISSQGSDAAIGMRIYTKSTGNHIFASSAGTYTQFLISGANNSVNYLQIAGTTATNAPILSSQGSDTNIDINLTPKGTGVLSFGTYTASALLAVAGYITIKDSGGTTRRLLVG